MTLHELLRIVQTMVPALVSLVAVRWVFFKVLRIAREKEIVDNPEARKLQKEPIPVLGGIAVLFGVLCGLLVGCCLIGTNRSHGVLQGCNCVPLLQWFHIVSWHFLKPLQ